MCEFCRESWSEETKVSKGDGFTCEFATEQVPEMCGAPATYQLKERIVDDHLCEQHAQELAEMLGEGLMRVYQVAGVAEGETLKPITEVVSCATCGKPAKFAEIAMSTIHFCKRHRGYSE